MAALWWDMKHHSRPSLFSPLWVSVATVSCHLEGPCSPLSFFLSWISLSAQIWARKWARSTVGAPFSPHRRCFHHLFHFNLCSQSPTCSPPHTVYCEFSVLRSITTSLLRSHPVAHASYFQTCTHVRKRDHASFLDCLIFNSWYPGELITF